MRQERDETAIDFHSRLTDKVRLCGYANSDRERFVRAQLLKGMRNQELAKVARTFGYDANFIVQAAARCESFEPEDGPQSADVLNLEQRKFLPRQQFEDRSSHRNSTGPPPKRFRGGGNGYVGRRGRCSRCNHLAHHNEQCPALTRRCNTCGQRGHFSATCRQRRVNRIGNSERNTTRINKDANVEKV